MRQYFPKGTDLSRHSSDDLAAVAATLDSRPRKTLGWRTPAETLNEYIATSNSAGQLGTVPFTWRKDYAWNSYVRLLV